MTEQTRDIYDLEAPFKITVPLQKAFIGEDGRRRLQGAASGPEVDLQAERVHPTLIDKWISHINSNPGSVIYRDWHKKDTTTADLGFVEKAWKDDNGHMWIDVVLDDDNPVAQYIHKSAMKGKQYGMSVYGKVLRFADEFVPELGRKVRTFYDATLEEVSNTTRPVWTPSLGTVLSKAVDEELSHAAVGDNSVTDKATETPGGNEQEVVDEAAAKNTTDAGAATAPDTQAAPADEADAEAVNAAVNEGAPVVEKAVSADSKKDEKSLTNIVKMVQALNTELGKIGLLTPADESEAAAEETTVQKSEVSDDDERFARIEKALGTLSQTVLAIAENTPAGTAPGLLRKAEEVDPVSELNAVEDPIERLRLAMAAHYGETGRLR